MPDLYVSLGSNINKEQNLINGLNAMKKTFGPLTLSSLFESEAVGFSGDSFYNMVVYVKTPLSVAEVANQLRTIEIAHGRLPNAKKFSSRTLDLDVLLYDDLVMEMPVQIPRKEITENAFVLWPLAELAGDKNHPVINKSYQELWQQFDQNKQQIRKVPFRWHQSITKD